MYPLARKGHEEDLTGEASGYVGLAIGVAVKNDGVKGGLPRPRMVTGSLEITADPFVCELQGQPDWNGVLPAVVSPKDVPGFDKTRGQPLSWPLRYSRVSYAATIRGLKAGTYEVRARAVDLNDFSQPEPRPIKKAGKNGLQVRRLGIACHAGAIQPSSMTGERRRASPCFHTQNGVRSRMPGPGRGFIRVASKIAF